MTESHGTLVGRPTVSVVICCYTLERWELFCKAVESTFEQTLKPEQVIICVDHNDEFLVQIKEQLGKWSAETAIPITAVANKYDGHLGSARNTGVEIATGDIVAFLDDDASASPDWLEKLTDPYSDPGVVAVGGSPLPAFQTARPKWFPYQCDWIFGCAYLGLPTTRGPLRHLIGANMSASRSALTAIGGFHSDNHDDMDMCHRIAHRFGESSVVFEPDAIVNHFVTAERVTWRYFWQRCYKVNKGKVAAFANMEEAGNLKAEIEFVVRSVGLGISDAAKSLRWRDPSGLARLLALLAGIFLSGLGHLAGRIALAFEKRKNR